jgi:hypothetical protein
MTAELAEENKVLKEQYKKLGEHSKMVNDLHRDLQWKNMTSSCAKKS